METSLVRNNVKLIFAQNVKGVIGDGKTIPWYCREDLRHFAKTTKGGVVIMGSTTYQSLNRSILEGRINVVVSRNEELRLPSSVLRFDSVEKVMAWVDEFHPDDEVYVIGGANLGLAMIPYCYSAIVSHVADVSDGIGKEFTDKVHSTFTKDITTIIYNDEWGKVDNDGKSITPLISITERKRPS